LPTIEENKSLWGDAQNWTNAGDEWSKSWGNAQSQWWFSIFPRLQEYVPTDRILEIAPGFGRWTQFLKNLCKELIVVDMSDLCILECKKRFSSSPNISYHVNDGKSLEMIPDDSIDFAFSFDSLVHAEDTILENYIEQLARKLKPNGVGFIHHSNLGEYKTFVIRSSHKPISIINQKMFGLNAGWRAISMTASKFELFAEKAGMHTISQEKINWHTRPYFLIDSISVFTRKGSLWDRPNKILRNNRFMAEAKQIRKLSELYSSS